MRIPQNVVFIWTGTHTAIPSGWARETTLDDKYPKATAVSINPNVTGGASTHTHTSPAHTHDVSAHTHTYTIPLIDGYTGDNRTDQIVNDILNNTHYHTGTSGAASAGTTGSTAVTYGSMSNDPPYTTVIFIKSQGAQNIPSSGGVVLTDQTSIPTGWQISDGTNSSLDLRNKYIKGATTGANAGTTGGSYTNSHDITHTHTTSTHAHAAANSGAQIGGGTHDGTPGSTAVRSNHVHSVSLSAATQAINSNADTLVTTETVEPAYRKLLALYNAAGVPKSLIKGMIGMWLGTLATIPSGWKLCDGNNDTPDMRDKFLKIATNTGDISETGGSNTHTHAAQAHSHTGNGSHTHTVPSQAHVAEIGRIGSGTNPADPAFAHTSATSDAATVNAANANTTADSSDNQPAFRTVAFIQYKFSVDGGALAVVI